MLEKRMTVMQRRLATKERTFVAAMTLIAQSGLLELAASAQKTARQLQAPHQQHPHGLPSSVVRPEAQEQLRQLKQLTQ